MTGGADLWPATQDARAARKVARPTASPDLMATAIEKRGINDWAAADDIVATHELDPRPDA